MSQKYEGIDVIRNPSLNRDLAFTDAQRDRLKIRGLIPPRVLSDKAILSRYLQTIRGLSNNLEKFIFMQDLQNTNETLFYQLLLENLVELVPVVYTPVVGAGCVSYSQIYRRPRGMWLSIEKDAGNVKQILKNWPEKNVKVIVITDGERILGLGDLGANGMGIPVGKLILYSVCAGINPSECLPITLDCGTNNQTLINDPLYIGNPHPRVRGDRYDHFIDEVIKGLEEEFHSPLIQFEDFGNINSFRLLEKYRNKVCTFNDDIQGTAAAAVGGILGAVKLTNLSLPDQKYLFLGAGAAGLGIAELIIAALEQTGMSRDDAAKRCWFVDSQGLIVKSRLKEGMKEEKVMFAHDFPESNSFIDAVANLKPTCIIGVSGQGKSFTKEIIEKLASFNEKPIIFALSNPTSKAECTAEEAYKWTKGKGIFASGSPFDPVEYNGRKYVPGQGNNAYIFPGVGLGIVVSRTRHVTEEMFLIAAQTLADQVTNQELESGSIYPSMERIREVSLEIAFNVAKIAFKRGLARNKQPINDEELFAACRAAMFDPLKHSSLQFSASL